MSKGRAKNRKRNTSEPAHVKMHGVITEDRVQEQVERTGTYPFTFASSAIIAAAALLGYLVLPAALLELGIEARASMLVLGPLLISAALALTRYFLDSKRGPIRGFWVTLVTTLVALLVIMYLMAFLGIAL